MTEVWLGIVLGIALGAAVASVIAGLFVRHSRDSVYDQGFQHGLRQGEHAERLKQFTQHMDRRERSGV